MADPRDELVDPILSNEPGYIPPNALRIRVSPYDTPPPVDDPGQFGWGMPGGEAGRPAGRLFEPDRSPAPEQSPKPQFQPGILSLGNVARGIGSLVQGARDAWNAPPAAPAAPGPPTATAPALVPPGRGRSNAPFDPMAGVRPAEGYPNATPATTLGGIAGGIGHAATEVLQEPYNMVRAGQDIAAPGATDQQVQQARQQEAGAATNLATNLYGLNAPFAAARPASAGVFGGRLAKGFDPNKEKLAELMHQNGVPAPQIWKETGMVKFADGKWAHEISDLGAYYKGDVDSIASRIFDQKYPDRAGTYGQGVRPGNMVRSDQAKMEALLKMQGKQQLYLPDVLHHPELFKRYPELLKMPVSQDAMMHAQGAYFPHSVAGTDVRPASIAYREQNQPGKMARGATFDTLLHEIQHAIAQIEGFAKGSNTHQMQSLMPGTGANKIFTEEMKRFAKPMSEEDFLAMNKFAKTKDNDTYAKYMEDYRKRLSAHEDFLQTFAAEQAYPKSAGEGVAELPPQRKDLTPQQAAAIDPRSQMRVPMDQQFVEYNRITNPQGTTPQQMGGILRPTMHEGPQLSAGPTPFLRPGRTMKEPAWQPVAPTVTDPQRVFKPAIYQNPRIIAEKAAEKVAAEHPALKELFGVTRADLYDISQQGRRKGNAEPDLFMPAKPGVSYAGANIQTPANERRLIDTLSEGLKHRGLREGMVPWYVMDPMFQHMVKLVGKEQAIKDYTRLNAIVPPFSASSDVLTEINRGTAANMYAKRGEYPTFHQFGGADRNKLPPGFPEDMKSVMGHAYHEVQSNPVTRWLETGKHGYHPDTVKIPTYIMASGVPETGFQTRWAVPDAHIARGSGMSDVRRNKSFGDYMGGSEYRTFAPWYREKIAKPLDLEAVPAQALQWGTFGHATGVDTPIGAGKLELFSQRIWERAKELGIDPKVLRDQVLRGDQHAVGLLTAGAGGAAGIGSLVAPNRQEVY